MDDNTRDFFKTHLGYNDEELKVLLSNPKNKEINNEKKSLNGF